MKILIISNVYPPYFIGGYELGCRDVVEALKSKGHDVRVLTSTYGLNKPQNDNAVYRWLETELTWFNIRSYKYAVKVIKKELINQKAYKKLVKLYKPDLVYMWNLSHISVSLAFLTEKMGLPVYYYVFDNWLSQWEQDCWYSLWNYKILHHAGRFGRKLINRLFTVLHLPQFIGSPELDHTQFASHYLKQLTLNADKPVAQGKVIHWGININKYSFINKSTTVEKRLLYVGQIIPHKGVLTAIEALKLVVQKYANATLTIVGGSVIKYYEAQVHNSIRSLNLANNVRLTGFVPHEDLPRIYSNHDILIFPSIWDEPFGITILEAMASGLAIVGTATGGSAEIIQSEINGLVFPKGDAKACSIQLLRLLDEPDLLTRLTKNARAMVESKFNFDDVVNKIEDDLQNTSPRVTHPA